MPSSRPQARGGPQTVLYFHPDAVEWVQRWRPRFELVESVEPPAGGDALLLWAAPEHLELHGGVRNSGRHRSQGAWVTTAEVRRRARQAPELLRACAVKPGMRVLDAMAGWGVDGLVLAVAGGRVSMVEREPLMQALEEDLIRRIDRADVESRLGDGFEQLDDAAGFDVIYLDPMFPERGKQALPGKRMQYLAALMREDGNERPLAEWVDRAVAHARVRVVLKRRLHDAPVRPPDWLIRGRTIRYDVYRGQGVQPASG